MNFIPSNVLVVDDNDLDVEKIERSFRNLRIACNYVRAHDGEEALQTIRNWHAVYEDAPSLILLDINMPRMNGLELLAMLEEQIPEFNVPIFVTTTSSLPGDISRAFKHGICGYIVKPVSIAESVKLMSTAGEFWQRVSNLAGSGGPGRCAA